MYQYQRLIVRIEFVVAVIAIALTFIFIAHFDWWWLIVLFFAFDISLLGYVVNPKIGSISYNTVHNLIVPVLLLIMYVIVPAEWLLFLGLLWLFHVCVDRALGFGLMYGDAFGHSNLSTVKLPKIKS